MSKLKQAFIFGVYGRDSCMIASPKVLIKNHDADFGQMLGRTSAGPHHCQQGVGVTHVAMRVMTKPPSEIKPWLILRGENP